MDNGEAMGNGELEFIPKANLQRRTWSSSLPWLQSKVLPHSGEVDYIMRRDPLTLASLASSLVPSSPFPLDRGA